MLKIKGSKFFILIALTTFFPSMLLFTQFSHSKMKFKQQLFSQKGVAIMTEEIDEEEFNSLVDGLVKIVGHGVARDKIAKALLESGRIVFDDPSLEISDKNIKNILLLIYQIAELVAIKEINISNQKELTKVPLKLDRLVELVSLILRGNNLASIGMKIPGGTRLKRMDFSGNTELGIGNFDALCEYLYKKGIVLSLDGTKYEVLLKQKEKKQDKEKKPEEQLKNIKSKIEKINKELSELGAVAGFMGELPTEIDDDRWDELQRELVGSNREKRILEDQIKEKQIKEIREQIEKIEEQIKKANEQKNAIVDESKAYQENLDVESKLFSLQGQITELNEEKWRIEGRTESWKEFVLGKTYGAAMTVVIKFLQSSAGSQIIENLSAALLLGDFITASKLATLLKLDLSEFDDTTLSGFMSTLGISKDFDLISQIFGKLGWADLNSMTLLDLAQKLGLDWTDSKLDREKKISLIITVLTVLTVCHQVAAMGGVVTNTYVFIRDKYGAASDYFLYITNMVKKYSDRVMYLKKLWTGTEFVS